MNFNHITDITKDELYLLKHIEDLIYKSKKEDQVYFSGFLNEREQALVKYRFCKEKDLNISFFGGYEEADRKIAAFRFYDEINEGFPISAIKIKIPSFSSPLNHRNILGSAMALGVKRTYFGDIIVNTSFEALLFCETSFSDYIKTNLNRIGKDNCSIDIIIDYNHLLQNKKSEDSSIIIASNRLDCFVAAITHKSREKACSEIKAGFVSVNYVAVYDVSKNLAENDVISIKGFGKYVFGNLLSTTQKGKLRIIIKKYI